MMPLGELEREGTIKIMDAVDMNEITWATCSRADICFMQRPFSSKHVHMAKIATNSGLPLWVDYDDDLLNVPTDNPTNRLYSLESTKKNILQILSMADVCTVSTRHLSESLRASMVAAGIEQIPQFRVIPNALNARLWKPSLREQMINGIDPQKVVLWRGSNTHLKDVMRHAPQIIQAAQKNPEWIWLFIGDFNPWMLEEYMPKGRLLFKSALDPMEFMKAIVEIRPSVMMVPLCDHEFNKSKSNIAWIEGTWAGATCVVPDMPEWRVPGAMNYKSPDHFGQVLEEAISLSNEERALRAELSWKEVGENYNLMITNMARRQIITELFAIR
jgi:hypothetical protein